MMVRRYLPALALLLTAACDRQGRLDVAPPAVPAADASTVSSVDIPLPDRSTLSDRSLAGRLNGYELIINVFSPDAVIPAVCASDAKHLQSSWTDQAHISAKLHQGCSYHLELRVGTQNVAFPADHAPLATTLFDGTATINAADLAGKSSYVARLVLAPYGTDVDVSLQTTFDPTSTGGQPATLVTYQSDIASILNRSCVTCHRPGAQSPDLSSQQGAQVAAPTILAAVQAGTMPLGGKLSADETQKIYDWVNTGAQ